MFQRWDICRAYVEYEEKSGGKRRPVLVINVGIDTFISFKITKNISRDDDLEYKIIKWQDAGLDCPSCVRLGHKVYFSTLDHLVKLGRLQKIDIDNIKILCQKYDIKLNEDLHMGKIDWDKVQWGVHQFSTNSIIFRGTEEECQKYIDDRKELWDDAEVYFMTPDDPYYIKQNEQELEEAMGREMINENTITRTLPLSIDKFLMDMSQMYIDDLSYNDISNFGDRATEEDINQLRKYRRELFRGFEEDDPKIQEIFKNIKNIVKGNLEEAMTNRQKLMKRFPELNLKEDIEKGTNKLNKQEVLDWISEHELAWEDFINYFEDIYKASSEVPMDEILSWVSEYDDLAEDFENKFGISINADVYDDFSEEEIEEHLAIDKYDQLNSPNILEITPAKGAKLKESVEGKWNIGSNKLVSTDSQEYANLVDLAKLLQERSPNGYEYRVEKTYEDFGAGMQWYTIICDEKNGWGTHQVLNPAQWIYLANTGDVEGTYQDLIADKYFRDKLKTDRTASLFTYMNNLDD